MNAPLVGQRLGYPELSGLDLLELFAFLHPARFVVPTPAGLSRGLGLSPPGGDADAADAGRQRVGDIVAVEVQRGDDAILGRAREDLLEHRVGDDVFDDEA